MNTSPKLIDLWRREAVPWHLGHAPAPRLRSAWTIRRTASVRIVGADVLRVTTAISGDVLTALRSRGVDRGPTLINHARRAVEFVVPRGTAALWPAFPHTRCATDAVLRCPAPSVTYDSGLHPQDGRIWLTPPGPDAPATTDPAQLAAAVRVALERRRTATPASPPGGTAVTAHAAPGGSRTEDLTAVVWRELSTVPPHGLTRPPQPSHPRGLAASMHLREVWPLPGDSHDTPRRARNLVVDTGRLWRVPRTVRQDLKLITSELTTNAVLHAPGPTLTVALFRSAEEAWVVVVDRGPRRAMPADGPPDDDAEHGRGLLLVRSLADRFTVQSCGPGTAAAAFLRLPPPPSRTEDDVDGSALSHPGSGHKR